MQPNQTVSPGQPDSAQFDFINQPQQPKKVGFSLGDPKRLLFVMGVLLVLILAAFLVFGRSGGGSKQETVDLVARAHEISRVSQLQNLPFKSTSVSDLAATTAISMNSQQNDFTAYLSKVHTKVGVKQLALRTKKSTDLDLQTAAINNNLDAAYLSYLRSALLSYQAALNSTYKLTKSKTLKEYLVSANSSVYTLLKSPLLTAST